MIPGDSFLIDPPWLFLIGMLVAWTGRHRDTDRYRTTARLVCGAVIACFWITSISLYFNAPWSAWIAEMCGAENGRDWMLNSGVFSFNYHDPGVATHAIAAAIFVTYPVWIYLGWKLGRRRWSPVGDDRPGN